MIKVVFFDFSKTVMKNSPADVISDFMGTADLRKEILYQRKQGLIDKREQGIRSAKCYIGFHLDNIARVGERFEFNLNIASCLRDLSSKGIKTVLVSNVCKQVLTILCKDLDFSEIFGSDYEVVDGRLTGNIISFANKKPEVIQDYLRTFQFKKEEAVAIGDSLDDVTMFEQVGTGILYKPEEKAKGKGDFEIDDFDQLLAIVDKLNTSS